MVCIAIGLVRGSSSLLIVSIVASLLAAVALVIGGRQNAARQAAAPEPADMPDPADDFPPPPGPAPRRTAGAPDAHDSAPAGAASAADSGYPGDSTTATGRTDPIGSPAADHVYVDRPSADQGPDQDLPRTGERAPDAGTHLPDESVVSPGSRADYQAASSTIGAARGGADDDQAWRRPTAEPGDEQAWARPVPEPAAEPFEPAAGHPGPSAGPVLPGPGSGADAEGADPALVDEFAEPDDDDPDDEPLPQSVRPTDAFQVARLDVEVLVVDGRPRYHMADCPHLVGRLTEPLPAAEAVELGFSPCGLCRPVDRLLGANVRR
ncbi:hypothetical protein [Actinoplanes sp. L3-i22]|uniref:hypothetical protein n=1 Tax=Actinoplanes sp. L3-i22 TaxID=2836373 RepID=UPI001C844B26|nr:hypothetical protein [Actinoplanes sp. L3-i22]